jgi:hypothetical protein
MVHEFCSDAKYKASSISNASRTYKLNNWELSMLFWISSIVDHFQEESWIVLLILLLISKKKER